MRLVKSRRRRTNVVYSDMLFAHSTEYRRGRAIFSAISVLAAAIFALSTEICRIFCFFVFSRFYTLLFANITQIL